ncbi:MAG: hypothetical protein ACQKBW_00050 [Puniceicoccales bacterium]
MKASLITSLLILLSATSFVLAQSQYAGTYYGELDEQVSEFGVVTTPRHDTAALTAVVTTSGDLTITGASEITGTVDAQGNITVTNDGGYGFETGTISDDTINMNGSHSQDGGARVNEYWVVATLAQPVLAIFPDAQAEGSGWYYVSWFGSFNTANFPWIYHETLHSMYATGNDQTELWLYFPPLQWMFTNKDTYPWFYSQSLSAWVYYDVSTTSAQWFYNQSTGVWFAENNQ